MKPRVHALSHLAVLAVFALGAGACRSAMPDSERSGREAGTDMHYELKSYHLVYSEHRGPVGYMKVTDVTKAGGPTYTWKYILDKDFTTIGWIDQMGHAFQYVPYPPGSMPNPREPLRVITLPEDSMSQNVMRMLGMNPAADNVSFPVAKEGDIGAAK